LTNKKLISDLITLSQKTRVGFEIPNGRGTAAMRRKVHGFFYALTVMVGSVLRSREARRILAPVSQPDTSSAALSLRSPVGGYTTTVK